MDDGNKYCIKCGFKLPDNNKNFCIHCGYNNQIVNDNLVKGDEEKIIVDDRKENPSSANTFLILSVLNVIFVLPYVLMFGVGMLSFGGLSGNTVSVYASLIAVLGYLIFSGAALIMFIINSANEGKDLKKTINKLITIFCVLVLLPALVFLFYK